jgi:hypothetical protein
MLWYDHHEQHIANQQVGLKFSLENNKETKTSLKTENMLNSILASTCLRYHRSLYFQHFGKVRQELEFHFDIILLFRQMAMGKG